MPTEELSEIPRPIRDDYARLLTDIAISEGVAPEIIAELLKVKQGTGISMFALGKPTTVKLSVDREFPIILDTKRGGRVFELAGQSDRNKTTSLIYMATLLGINWDQTRPFLDRDDKVYNIATQRVCADLSRGQNAELRLASKAYELSITVADRCATVSLLDEDHHFTPGFNNTCISLASLEDWPRYRELMMLICDVQFVGKSRDFIGQVSIEESKDLSQFCEIVLDRAGRVRSYLQNQPQTYSRTEQELKTEIAQMTKRRADMKKEIDELNQQIEGIENFIRDIQKLIATYRELEDTQNSEVQEALRRLKLEEAVRDQDKKLQEYERSIQDLERELEDVLQQLSQQEPRFTSVMSSLEDLRVKISGELKNISALNSLCSQVLRGIANKDYSSMFTFYNFAQVDNNVITLLDSILEATRPFSKGLVIPFDSGEEPGKKLNDLEKDLLNAKARVVDIQKLNPELTKTYQTLQAVRISSAPELHRLETDVNTARALVMSKKRMLEDRRKDLKLINDTIQSLLGTENLQSLKLRINQLRQALPKKLEEMLEQYERLAHSIGYSDPWQLDLSELQIAINQSQVKLQELKDTQVSKERVESQLKDRLFEIQRNSSSLRSGTGRSPLEALHRLQNVLGSIIDYLGEYRRRREGERLYDPLELERITQRFGEHVDMVHKTLNRVIAQRCPVMYKNRETGPVRLTVQDYDFLRGEQFIPELLRGEWAGGGGDSAMTVLGLATRSSGSHIGTILLVDEFNDAETFKKIVCDDLATLDQLAYAIFVKQDPELKELKFEVMK